MCSCYLGYHISSNNKTCVGKHIASNVISNRVYVTLTDIDECALGISGCNQICTNTIGSYVCSCYFGYQIYSHNKTCIGKQITSIMK